MKRFVRLSEDEQQKAVLNRLGSILETLVDRRSKLNDEANGNNAQATIETLIQKAFDDGDPRNAIKYIMEADLILADGTSASMREFLLELAEEEARECWYQEPFDRVLEIEYGDGTDTVIRG